MELNEIDTVSFAEASLRHMVREDYANDEAWTLANRMRDIHEIVHVISGYGTDLLGEMCELAFIIRQAPRPRASRFAIRVNVAYFRRNGYRHAEAAIGEAFQRGCHVGLMVAADWEAMMDWQLDDVRSRLGISEPPPYEPIAPGEFSVAKLGGSDSLSIRPSEGRGSADGCELLSGRGQRLGPTIRAPIPRP